MSDSKEVLYSFQKQISRKKQVVVLVLLSLNTHSLVIFDSGEYLYKPCYSTGKLQIFFCFG